MRQSRSAATARKAGSVARTASMVASSGVKSAFDATGRTVSEKSVREYLAFGADNTTSIKACITRARTNARSVRTALTIELWEAINGAWNGLNELGEPTKVSVRDGDRAKVIVAILGKHEYSPAPKVGTSYPLHAGAASKVILAHLSEDEVEQVLAATAGSLTVTLWGAGDLYNNGVTTSVPVQIATGVRKVTSSTLTPPSTSARTTAMEPTPVASTCANCSAPMPPIATCG